MILKTQNVMENKINVINVINVADLLVFCVWEDSVYNKCIVRLEASV